jgi:hypothetical protein
MADIEETWDLFHSLWDELDLERKLIEIWPIEKRWQLDLLVARVGRMDDAIAEMVCDEMVALALEDNDDECVELLESERANGDFVRQRKVR